MFKICSSIENWLLADESNIAAIHCLTGKGRTGTVLACYLAWTGQFPNALEALEYVAEQRNSSVEKLTIPSQRRYVLKSIRSWLRIHDANVVCFE